MERRVKKAKEETWMEEVQKLQLNPQKPSKNAFRGFHADQMIIELPSFNILTNDPSMTAWGWVVLNNKGEILDKGCIKTKTEGKKRRIRKSDETCQRIAEINQTLIHVITQQHIDFLLTESPHGSQNASAAVMIGVVAAIMQTISDCLQIPIEFYSEGDSKKCALGKLSAEKKEMIVRMMQIYGDEWVSGIKWRDEAIADALAIHYCANKNSVTLKMMKR